MLFSRRFGLFALCLTLFATTLPPASSPAQTGAPSWWPGVKQGRSNCDPSWAADKVARQKTCSITFRSTSGPNYNMLYDGQLKALVHFTSDDAFLIRVIAGQTAKIYHNTPIHEAYDPAYHVISCAGAQAIADDILVNAGLPRTPVACAPGVPVFAVGAKKQFDLTGTIRGGQPAPSGTPRWWPGVAAFRTTGCSTDAGKTYCTLANSVPDPHAVRVDTRIQPGGDFDIRIHLGETRGPKIVKPVPAGPLCDGHKAISTAVLEHAGHAPVSIASCRITGKVGFFDTIEKLEILGTARPLGAPKPPPTCDAAVLTGKWKPSEPRQIAAGLQLAFRPQAANAKLMDGRFTAYRQHEHLIGGGLTSISGVWTEDGKPDGAACVIRYRQSPSATQGASAVRYDKATDSFIFMQGHRPDPSMPGRWTRGDLPPPPITCGRAEINGVWNRSDGARISIGGVDTFKDGGNAIMQHYPNGEWPAGQMKFRNIREVSECRYTADCAGYQTQKSPTGQIVGNVRYENQCTLTVDPVKRTMSASGNHGQYRRNP